MISVIVPARNAEKMLESCLQALIHQQGLYFGQDYEVIVVDDGSSDGTAQVAQETGVKLITIAHHGPAAARNAGARVANGQILAYTDADCIAAPTWLLDLSHPFYTSDIVGVKGVYRTSQQELIARFVQLEYEYKYVRMRKLAYIDFIDTNNAAYRTDIFLENGGFDESFPVPSVEDQEFSFRLARKGYHMIFEPQACVFHQHDRTLLEYLSRKFNIGYWKAYMLRWTPEKTFSDSHTAPTQRLEILVLALLFATFPLMFIWSAVGIPVFFLTLLIFQLITIPFLSFIAKSDLQVLAVAPLMLLFRAGALGTGLLKGFLVPPVKETRGLPCQSMKVRFVKRLLDLIGASFGLVISIPVIFITAVAIRLDSPGPVLYRQQRAGENGKPFMILKLRTMVVDADEQIDDVLQMSHLNGPAFKIQNDPRITRVGRFLRRWSLDELPQFWNVLEGEMSLVGPRPEELRIVEKYTDAQRERLIVKPGMTGPMQVSGRGELDFEQRLQLEISYLRNYSLAKDFSILCKTLHAVLSGEGAL